VGVAVGAGAAGKAEGVGREVGGDERVVIAVAVVIEA